MLTFKILGGTYDIHVDVCITDDKQRALKYIKKKLNKSFHESDFGRGNFFFSGSSSVIWVPRIPKTPREHGTVGHEIFHAVYHILSWASVNLSESSEEAFCHLIGHMTTQFYNKIKKNGHTR